MRTSTLEGDGTVIGRVFDDRYEVVRTLGSGGMADVYLANDRLLGRQVALKVLSSRYATDEQFIERFRREASSAASLNHPNIVQIYDRGEAEGTYYIAMEYLEGRSLKEIIVKYAPLAQDLVLSIATQILEALRFAHRRDVIHRDIKPQNIIVDNEGRVKVTDFGIARAGSVSTMTEAGSILGTAHYLSPEQAQGKPVEAASDLYSLGVVMYEMLTGKLPFDGDNPVSIAMQHAHEHPPTPRSVVPDLPENLEAVILRSLGKRPIERYLTAQAMLDDLERVQNGEPISIPAPYMEEPTQIMKPVVGAAAAATGGPGMQPTQIRRRTSEAVDIAPEPYFDEPPRRQSVWPWLLVIVLILALGGAAYAIFSNWGDTETEFGIVPDVVRLSRADAEKMIKDAGFKPEYKGEEESSDYAAGEVLRQSPKPGIDLKKGETVEYWVSSGENEVQVPDLVGLSEADAAEKLASRGLERDTQKEATADEDKVGKVLRQEPQGGEYVDEGHKVTIWVGEASEVVAVPLLIGMTQEQAISLLLGMDLVPEPRMVDSELTGGTVVNQNPSENTPVEPGSKVVIEISNAPEPTTVRVPPVANLGYTLAEARQILAEYSLRWRVTDYPTAEYDPGIVLMQDPAFGEEVEKNSVVELWVSTEETTTTTTTEPPTTSTEPPTTTTEPPTTSTEPATTTIVTEF
ncbi:MAG: Stk1 family PASTA domain-containing Ser/Thr kinase [Thermoleophilia bacterium]|nr:Stk1 family PASTA domain-containing Ser/Thr kinase [Thermoleophilia bacterium]